MEKKLLMKYFEQIFHITNIKHNTVGIPFITKFFPTVKILNCKLEKNTPEQKIHFLLFLKG